MHFTASQLDAIAAPDGHLQLIACAGSGKTEVVARRVAELLRPDRTPPLEPRQIVAFTFTDKAAAELKERIVARVREAHGERTGLAEMFVGTIHGFCLALLQREVPAFLKYVVLDATRQKLLIARHPARTGLAHVRRLDDGRALNPDEDAGVYLAALDVLRQADLVPERARGLRALDALAAWRELLEERRYLDYTGIMEHAVRVLREDPGVRRRLAQRVRHVIVDEYQDVNPIQERVIGALAGLGAALCVVGDDDQTIYQWNGADLRNVLGFAERYQGATTVRLQENFRSSRAVVEVARDFVAQNRHRLPKDMVPTDAQPFEHGDLQACAFASVEDEAAWVADTLRELHGVAFDDRGSRRGLAWSDMAILVRAGLQRAAAPIAEALAARGIPYLVSGMNTLFDTREAHAARVLFYFVAGRGGVARDDVRRAWEQAELGLDASSLGWAMDLAEATRAAIPELTAEDARECAPQRVLLEFLDRAALREERVPGEKGRGEVVFYNLGVFSRLLGDFDAIHFHSSPAAKYERLAHFLEHAAADQYGEGWLENPFASPDAVRILTIHKAKGLQWPVVVVPGLVQNRFPNTWKGRSNWWHLVPADAVVGGDRYQGDLEEERRLFYVAMTRAQKWLFATCAPQAGHRLWGRPSEFFAWFAARPEVARGPISLAHRPRTAPRSRAGVANVEFTFTKLKHLFECPYQFKLRVLYGFEGPVDEAAGLGRALHDALAEVHQRALEDGVRLGPGDAAALVDRHLHLPYATPETQDRLRETARRVIETYLARHGDVLERVEVAEKPIELSLGDGVTVAGRIDLVYRRETGETSIVDFKSNARAQAEDVTEAQLQVYTLGYRALTGRDADALEIWDLDADRRSERPVDESLLEGVARRVRAAADMLRSGDLPARPDRDRCARCDFHTMCSAGAEALAAEGEG